MRQEALQTIYELAKKDPRVVFIGSDLGVGVLQKFKEEMPDRFIMEGISEAHIVGLAAGMAMEGWIPYVNTIATFLTRRCFEQVALDMCLHNVNVRLVANGGGLVYAPLGPTHLAIEDMAILRTLPNMSVVAPADPIEMISLIESTVDHKGPMYFRIAKGGEPNITSELTAPVLGQARVIKQGGPTLLVTTGVALHIALEASTHLSTKGCEVSIIHYPTIKPFDTESLLKAADKSSHVICIEEGVRSGGLGSIVLEELADAGALNGKKISRIGISDSFPDKYGSQKSLMDHCGLSAQSIITAVEQT